MTDGLKPVGILVVGMHRSGTSALAGVLGKMGVSLSNHLLEPGADNPKGYWEHQRAVDINEQLLHALERTWDDIRNLPATWLTSSAALSAREQIIDLIKADFGSSPLWAIKDPRLCRLLPLWISCLRDLSVRPVVLFAVRHPFEVAASIETRNHWRRAVGLTLWLRHVFEAEIASRHVARTVVLYENLLANPSKFVEKALKELAVDVPDLDDATRSHLAKFVDTSDRHHVLSASSVNDDSRIDKLALKAHAALLAISRGTEGWHNLGEFADRFEAEWRRSGALPDALAEMVLRERLRLENKESEILKVRSSLNAQIRWSEDAVETLSSQRQEGEQLRAQQCDLTDRLEAERAEKDALQRELTDRLEAERAEKDALQRELTERLEAERAAKDALQRQLTSRIEAARLEKARLEQERETLKVELSARLEMVSEAADVLQENLKILAEERHRMKEELQVTRKRHNEAELEIAALRETRSWKLTKPLRWAKRVTRGAVKKKLK